MKAPSFLLCLSLAAPCFASAKTDAIERSVIHHGDLARWVAQEPGQRTSFEKSLGLLGFRFPTPRVMALVVDPARWKAGSYKTKEFVFQMYQMMFDDIRAKAGLPLDLATRGTVIAVDRKEHVIDRSFWTPAHIRGIFADMKPKRKTPLNVRTYGISNKKK